MKDSRIHYIDGRWVPGLGEEFSSLNPATGEVIWTGRNGLDSEVAEAVTAAKQATADWGRRSVDERKEVLRSFAAAMKAERDRFARLISEEVGKPLWEARTEVDAVVGKADASIEALEKRATELRRTLGSVESVTRFKAHGVVAVLAPFNFPMHMANGHIMPALLAGNTIVFKPSELAPKVAGEMVRIWEQVGLPPGVLNLIQGDGRAGACLVSHDGVAGVLFTGSRRVGVTINVALAQRPEKIVALEMGGNSPLVVWDYQDVQAAVYVAIQSAFITTGQRCSAARRLIVQEGDERFVDALRRAATNLRAGAFDEDPEPYMGPLITEEAAQSLLDLQDRLIKCGAEAVLRMERPARTGAFVTPGLIDVTGTTNSERDAEFLGPLLQITRVRTFDQAIRACNDTDYGLAAGLVSGNEVLYHQFLSEVTAGIINWNQQLTGATAFAPFGGLKASGNHRPSAYFAADYCSHAVASMEVTTPIMPEKLPPGYSA